MCTSEIAGRVKQQVQLVQQGKKTEGRSDAMSIMNQPSPPITHQALRPRSQRSSSVVTGMYR